MVETPRTNAVEYTLDYEKNVVDADFARQLETELADKDRLLAEARADAGRMADSYKQFCKRTKENEAEHEKQLKEARAEIENKKEIMYEWLKEHAYKINHADKAIADRDKLIEQMREALKSLYSWVKAEAEHFGANTPDDDMIKLVEAAIQPAGDSNGR